MKSAFRAYVYVLLSLLAAGLCTDAKADWVQGFVFEDVNFGGGVGRSMAASGGVPVQGVTVELYNSPAGTFVQALVTDPAGQYFFNVPGGSYFVRVVNSTVVSTRPINGGFTNGMAVQTYRFDPLAGPIVNEVGGAAPALVDPPANTGAQTLAMLNAPAWSQVQSLTAANTNVAGVNFGFNFDTIVNGNASGQGSLGQFIKNSDQLANTGLSQVGLTPGVETSIFMIPSNADPLGRAMDPGFDIARGVAVINLTGPISDIHDADTAVDGRTQTANIGNTNPGTLGFSGAVGLGADIVRGTLDDPSLSGVAAPEVELVGYGIRLSQLLAPVLPHRTRIYGLSIWGAPEGVRAIAGAVRLSGIDIRENVIGTRADSFSTPATRNQYGIYLDSADGGRLVNNLVGFVERAPVLLGTSTNGWIVSQNEVRAGGQVFTTWDGILVWGSAHQILENLIVDNNSVGIDGIVSTGGHTIRDNTISANGLAGVQTAGIRLFGTDSLIERNVIENNTGAGILVAQGTPKALRNRITTNVFGGNGGPAIDLVDLGGNDSLGDGVGDGISATGLGPTAGNQGLAFPVIASATSNGGVTTVSGNGCPSCRVEIYRAAAGAGDSLGVSDYGEGLEYLGFDDADGAGAFTLTGIGGLTAGDSVAAIAIDGNDNTSEFSANQALDTLQIVKRAFQLDGTPIASGSTLPSGIPVRFLLYVSNPAGGIADVSLRDDLVAAFQFQPGSIRFDNSVNNCASVPCTPAEEAAILAAVGSGSIATEASDGDPISFSGTVLHAGDSAAPNASLNLAAGRVWAVLFDVILQ